MQLATVDREVLKRIIALLFGFAALADRVARLPRPASLLLLRLLYPAEAAGRRLLVWLGGSALPAPTTPLAHRLRVLAMALQRLLALADCIARDASRRLRRPRLNLPPARSSIALARGPDTS